MHPHTSWKILSALRLYLGPDSHSYETQTMSNWCLNAAQMNPPEMCSVVWTAPNSYNSRTDAVYTNAEIAIITFLNARLNQYHVSKI